MTRVYKSHKAALSPPGFDSVAEFAKRIKGTPVHVHAMIRRGTDPLPSFRDNDTGRIFIPVVRGLAWHKRMGRPPKDENTLAYKSQVSVQVIDRLIRRLDAAKYPKAAKAFKKALEVYAKECTEEPNA